MRIEQLYAASTEADFAHMERRLASATPEELQGPGAALAQLFLLARSMERAEADVMRLFHRAEPLTNYERFNGAFPDSFSEASTDPLEVQIAEMK